jgi:hypothetical protein
MEIATKKVYPFVVLIIAALVAILGAQSPELFTIDLQGTNVTIYVGRAWLFGFAGHDHEIVAPGVKGEIAVDRADIARSRLSLEFDAAALKVTGKVNRLMMCRRCSA